MMRVVVIVRIENSYMLQKNDDEELYTLPYCMCDNVNDGFDLLNEFLGSKGVKIEITEIFDEMEYCNEKIVVCKGQVSQYTIKTDDSIKWVESEEIEKTKFENWCFPIKNQLLNTIKSELHINQMICKSINSIFLNAEDEVEIRILEKKIHAFVRNDFGGDCPYVFSLEYTVEDDKITFINYWSIARMYADGEKSDLYVLFANTMNIIIKIFFAEYAEVNYFDYVDLGEVCGATIIFNEKYYAFSDEDFIKKIEELFIKYMYAMQVHYTLFGTYGLNLRRNGNDNKNHMYEKIEFLYNIEREDHNCHFGLENGIMLLEINDKQYQYSRLPDLSQWELLECIDGKILYQNIGDKKTYNYIPEDRWNVIKTILKGLDKENCNLICQEDKFYILDKNRIWIIEGAYYHYWIEDIKQEISKRQEKENRVLFFDRNFEWKFPINPTKFEELIADLVELDTSVSKVRLLGKSNNADGGRDLLIYKRVFDPDKDVREKLIIGQCKAYKNSVNKSHVTDIRDMLDNYDASGFLLAVTSNLTTPLVDNLVKLKKIYEVDWWTEREIFGKIRKNFFLFERYKDIIKILD